MDIYESMSTALLPKSLATGAQTMTGVPSKVEALGAMSSFRFHISQCGIAYQKSAIGISFTGDLGGTILPLWDSIQPSIRSVQKIIKTQYVEKLR